MNTNWLVATFAAVLCFSLANAAPTFFLLNGAAGAPGTAGAASPFAGLTSPFAGLTSPFAGLTSPFAAGSAPVSPLAGLFSGLQPGARAAAGPFGCLLKK